MRSPHDRPTTPQTDRGDELTRLETHFAFGRNWRSFATTITEAEIADAVDGLSRILGRTDLQGLRFLDIGCGSGLHSLAALRMGASSVMAIDIDPESVEATRATLARHSTSRDFQVQTASVFDLDPRNTTAFDVVYAWGVLHHTGAMHAALRRAAELVEVDGLLATALYRRTLLCPAWRLEKRWYSRATARKQQYARAVYALLVRIGALLSGRDYEGYVAGYGRGNRGMDFEHDVHDWLGGYPYESITHREMAATMRALGFAEVSSTVRRDAFSLSGILGSGCDEYLHRRETRPPPRGDRPAES